MISPLLAPACGSRAHATAPEEPVALLLLLSLQLETHIAKLPERIRCAFTNGSVCA